MSLPVININETEKLSKAMETGAPFFISDKKNKLLVYDPELKVAADELISKLEEAENCKERVNIDEFWEKADKA